MAPSLLSAGGRIRTADALCALLFCENEAAVYKIIAKGGYYPSHYRADCGAELLVFYSLGEQQPEKQGKKPLLVACDIYRPGASEQLETLAKSIGVEPVGSVFTSPPGVKQYTHSENKFKSLLSNVKNSLLSDIS